MLTIEHETQDIASTNEIEVAKNDTQLFYERVTSTLDGWTDFPAGDGNFSIRKVFGLFEGELAIISPGQRLSSMQQIVNGIERANVYGVFELFRESRLFYMPRASIEEALMYSYTRKRILEDPLSGGNIGKQEIEKIFKASADAIGNSDIGERMDEKARFIKSRKEELSAAALIEKSPFEIQLAKFIPESGEDFIDFTIDDVIELIRKIRETPNYAQEDFREVIPSEWGITIFEVDVFEFVRYVDEEIFSIYHVNNTDLRYKVFLRSLRHMKRVMTQNYVEGREVTAIEVFEDRKRRVLDTIFSRKRRALDKIEELRREKQ